MAISPVLIAVAYRYSHVSHPLLRDVQQKMADVATVAEENIVGVHVVKSFAQEHAEQAKFERRSEAVFALAVRANRQRAFYIPLLGFLPLLSQAAILLIGGRMVANGRCRSPASCASTSTSRCSSCRCARSACGSARRSGRPRPASASSRSSTSPRNRGRTGGGELPPGAGRVLFDERHLRLRRRAAGAAGRLARTRRRAGSSR